MGIRSRYFSGWICISGNDHFKLLAGFQHNVVGQLDHDGLAVQAMPKCRFGSNPDIGRGGSLRHHKGQTPQSQFAPLEFDGLALFVAVAPLAECSPAFRRGEGGAEIVRRQPRREARRPFGPWYS